MEKCNLLGPNSGSKIHAVDTVEAKNIFLNEKIIPSAPGDGEITRQMILMTTYFEARGAHSASFNLSGNKKLVLVETYEYDEISDERFTWTLVAVVDSTGQFLTYKEFTDTNDYPLEESVRNVKGKVYVQIGSRFFRIDYR